MISRSLSVILAAIFLGACSDGENQPAASSDPTPESGSLPPSGREESLQQFTGARTKLVWTQYQNPDKVDKQGTSKNHYLMAIDSADGRGERRVLPAKDNYAYPIITPDGKHIVFTRKQKIEKGGKRKFDVSIEIVGFDGSGLKKLGDGYAQEVWEDPATGRFWVYAGEEFVLHGGTAPVCKRIIRFPLDAPEKRETVWDKTRMGTDSFAISADAKRFSGLFPWPDAGIGNLESNDWEKLTNGCWVSMAPDNSYDSWVFDVAHKNLLMFDASGEQTAKLPVNTHPDLEGRETYHPRWGNHRQFFVQSGPHTSGKKKKGHGKPIEIYLGKFSPDLRSIEGWFKVSNNSLPDIYPDVWVEPSEDPAVATTAEPETRQVPKSTRWPSAPGGLIFKWENVRAKNEFAAPGGDNEVSKLEPKGLARYGRHYEMVLDGGTFDPILDSDQLVNAIDPEAGNFGFQGLVTVNAGTGELLAGAPGRLTIEISPQPALRFTYGSRQVYAPLNPPSKTGTPVHVALSVNAGEGTFFVDGQAIASSNEETDPGDAPASAKLQFGAGFDGTLEQVALYDRPLPAAEVAADFALIQKKLDARKPVGRRQVRGKLIAKSPLPQPGNIKPYVRALVYYAYEVEGENIAVAHWAILDSRPLGGLDREIGMSYDLTIEPKDAHPQLVSQAESMDEEKIDFLMPLYYDVTTPTPIQ